MRLSYSQINLYESCSEKWYNQYVLKIKPPSPIEFKYGGIIHSMLQNYWRVGFKEMPENTFDFADDLQHTWDVSHKMVENGIGCLRNEVGWGNTVWVEKRIYLPNFVGIIDLVIEDKKGRAIIIDWKTTSYPYSLSDAIKSDQLSCYAWLYKRKWGELPHKVGFITLNKNTGEAESFLTVKDEQDIRLWEEKVKIIGEKMRLRVCSKNPTHCFAYGKKCFFYDRCWTDETERTGLKSLQSDF